MQIFVETKLKETFEPLQQLAAELKLKVSEH
jgi:hypothetical protein